MPVNTAGTEWFPVLLFAACADGARDPDAWFPVSRDPADARREAADALAFCGTCPVRALCLELSLRHLENRAARHLVRNAAGREEDTPRSAAFSLIDGWPD